FLPSFFVLQTKNTGSERSLRSYPIKVALFYLGLLVFSPSRTANRGTLLSFPISNFRGAASLDLLNPLPPPSRRLEGIREILCFVDDLAVAELHNAHRECCSFLVRDCVFRDPEIPVSENPLDLEAGRLAGMMTSQGLQITPPEDSLARLRIVTNGIGIINIVFRVCIAGC